MCINTNITVTDPFEFLITPYEYKVIGTAVRIAEPYSTLAELAERAERAIAGDPAMRAAFDGIIAALVANLPEPVKWTGPITTGTEFRNR